MVPGGGRSFPAAAASIKDGASLGSASGISAESPQKVLASAEAGRSQTIGNAASPRVRTHKGDSIIEGFVIHGFRQETCNESRLFLAYEGSVRTA